MGIVLSVLLCPIEQGYINYSGRGTALLTITGERFGQLYWGRHPGISSGDVTRSVGSDGSSLPGVDVVSTSHGSPVNKLCEQTSHSGRSV
jgi:hypothetical protein